MLRPQLKGESTKLSVSDTMADTDSYLCALIHSALLDCVEQPPLQGWGTFICLRADCVGSAACYPCPEPARSTGFTLSSTPVGTMTPLEDDQAPRPGIAKLPSLKSRWKIFILCSPRSLCQQHSALPSPQATRKPVSVAVSQRNCYRGDLRQGAPRLPLVLVLLAGWEFKQETTCIVKMR